MSAERKAAARRARLREILRTKTQAEAPQTQRELLKQLGADVVLRTLKRDLRVLRGSVPKGTSTKRAGGANRSKTSSTMRMDRINEFEQRLAAIEGVQLRIVDFLGKLADFAAESRKDALTLLAITNGAAADHAKLNERVERMQNQFSAAADAESYTNH